MQLWVVMYKNLHAIEDIFRHKTLKVKKMKTVELIMGFRFCLNTLWVYRSLNLYKTAAIRFLYFLSKHTWSVIHTTSDTMSTSSYYIRLPNNIFTCKYDVLKLTLYRITYSLLISMENKIWFYPDSHFNPSANRYHSA